MFRSACGRGAVPARELGPLQAGERVRVRSRGMVVGVTGSRVVRVEGDLLFKSASKYSRVISHAASIRSHRWRFTIMALCYSVFVFSWGYVKYL